jgi:hypothetical protein
MKPRKKISINKTFSFGFLFLMLTLTFTISSCDLFTGGSSTGTLKVVMHDNPGDFQSIMVDIQRVEVNNRLDEGSGWIVVAEPGEQYDLLELVNGAQAILGEAELDEGVYRQIRLILGDNNSITVNDTTWALMTPSAQQTGVKLNINAEIREGITYTIALDFDAGRSIVTTGSGPGHGPNSGPYLLKPVIRAYSQAETGTISGIIEPAESEPWIYAVAGEDTVSSTRSEAGTGEFRLMGLPEDTYTVIINPVSGDFEEIAVTDVEVTAGEDTFLGTIEL